MPSAPEFDPDTAVFEMKAPQNEKLVIKFKEECRSSKVSSDDGLKTRISKVSNHMGNSYEFEQNIEQNT
jgi:hypothetical protein